MGAQAATALAAGTGLGTPPPGAELPAAGRLVLAAPGVDLDRVARGHGAVAHPPSAYVDGVLHRVVRLPSGPRAVRVLPGFEVEWPGPDLDAADRTALDATLRDQLALDDDLEPLWQVCDATDREWVRATGAGRVLRAQTVWEDAVGVLAGTRTSWRTARAVLGRLGALTTPGPHGERPFPNREEVADAGPARLAEAGLGFRAPWVHALATDDRDLQQWRDGSGLTDEEVRAQMLVRPGLGPFSAATLAALVGRPRGLSLDGWAARTLGLTPPEAERQYAPLGRWAGTVAWLDLLRARYPGSAS